MVFLKKNIWFGSIYQPNNIVILNILQINIKICNITKLTFKIININKYALFQIFSVPNIFNT